MSRALLQNQPIGEYRVEDFLGAGGMGEVYRARHSKIGRVAAVKVLTQATRSGGFVERFFNEARIQASLQHPNIAALYDFCEVAGQPCIIMEYVDGQTVAERVAGYGALPPSESAYVFEKVVEAIEHIHRHGIIHRDIKSNNIKVSAKGEVKLLDFGIAKGQASPGLTQVGSVVGTLHYLAPELVRGGTADARGDIWALGVLLYEMVTGRVPFHADTLGDLCDRIDRAAYTPPAQLNPGLPREASNIIARCLRRNPAERYQTAGELLQDARRLSAAVAGPGLSSEVSEVAEEYAEAKPRGGRSVALLAGAAAAVVLLFIVGAAALFMMTSSDAPGEVAGADTTAAANAAPAASAEERVIEIHMSEGRAEVLRDGRVVGTTPFTLKARLGERVRLTLRRDGFDDEPVDFTVSEKKIYTFTMSR